MTTFRKLGLSDNILESIFAKGFKTPTPVQEAVIPLLLEANRDLIVQAQTGTGKTAAFGLPICERIDHNKKVQALVLTPTRELAIQVCDEIESFVTESPVKCLPVYGGAPIMDQRRALKKGVEVVVGTPGRIIDCINRGYLKTDMLQYVVLDEVDEMLSMGFIEDIEYILDQTPEDATRLMFSATMPRRLQTTAEKHLKDPQNLKMAECNETAALINHLAYECYKKDRLEVVTRIIALEEDIYGIIFCKTKAETEELAAALNSHGVSAEYLHGDVAQSSRETTLKRFRKRQNRLLIATDVAARGIDINDLTHVINFSVPESYEAYTHRCGRTGRQGKNGTAITIVGPPDKARLSRIQKATGFHIQYKSVPAGEDIARVQLSQFKESIAEAQPSKINIEVACELLAENDPIELLGSILEHCVGENFNPDSYKELSKSKGRSRNDRGGGSSRGKKDKGNSEGRGKGKKREFGRAKSKSKGETQIRLEKGIQDQFTGRTLAAFIEKKTNLSGRNINNLMLYKRYCTFTVPQRDAEITVKKLNDRVNTKKRKAARIVESK